MTQDVSALARGALDWLVASAQATESGLGWGDVRGGEELDPTLYSGAAGIVFALLEGYRHFGDDRYRDAALGAAGSIAAAVDEVEDCSLYVGLTGMAVALRTISDLLGDPSAGAAADRALDRVRARFDGERWGDLFELLCGNAGIALGALRAGDIDLAVMAVEPYLRRAERTPGGVQWELISGAPARFHHVSHGTLGIAYALAAVGQAAGRSDLTEMALAGAADVVARNDAGPEGFLVAHSDLQHKPEIVERYSYGRPGSPPRNEGHPAVPLWTWDEDEPRIRPDRSYFAFWRWGGITAAAWGGRLPNSFSLLARRP